MTSTFFDKSFNIKNNKSYIHVKITTMNQNIHSKISHRYKRYRFNLAYKTASKVSKISTGFI